MNVQKIKELASVNDETTKVVIQNILERKRSVHNTNLANLRKVLKEKYNTELNRDSFDWTFQQLESAEVGKINRSPRGAIQSFTWKANPIEVAKVIEGKDLSIKDEPKESKFDKTNKTKSGIIGLVMLENDKTFKLSLPEGLTQRDKGNIIKLIKSLPEDGKAS